MAQQQVNLLLKVGKLHQHRIIQHLPKWYQAVQLVPPPTLSPRCFYQNDLQGSQSFENELTTEQEKHYRSQIQALLASETETEPKSSRNSSIKKKSKNQKEKFKPKPIVFPEDILRRRFYQHYPFELLRPQQLAESGPITIDYSTPLIQRKNVTGEDVIQHQLYLISQGMTVDEAFRKVANDFESVRIKEEELKVSARNRELLKTRRSHSSSTPESERILKELKARYPKNYQAWLEEEKHLSCLNETFPTRTTP